MDARVKFTIKIMNQLAMFLIMKVLFFFWDHTLIPDNFACQMQTTSEENNNIHCTCTDLIITDSIFCITAGVYSVKNDQLQTGPLQPEEESPLMAILPSESPIIRRPSPIAIRIIEKFLRQRKLRLVDLFTVVDKDKNWLITRDDFRKAIQQVNNTCTSMYDT